MNTATMHNSTADINENIREMASKFGKSAGFGFFKKDSDDKSLSGFGFFIRAAAILLAFAAVVAAAYFGLQYGAAYVATLGLSETVTMAVTYGLNAVAFIGSLAAGWFTGSGLVKLFVRRSATKAANKAAAK